MGIIEDLLSLPRRIQPVRHIFSRERRHREMMEHRESFEAFVLSEMKKKRRKK